jgi:histidyl-tRNA synthetase
MLARNWLFEKFRAVSRQYGFQEYDAPLLEFQDLYQRKSGEEIFTP